MSKISIVVSNDNPQIDVTNLTKRGIKRILLTPRNSISFDGIALEANKQYDITFPELNGTLPSHLTFASSDDTWECGCRIMELAGKGNSNYFAITKENNNGVPT